MDPAFNIFTNYFYNGTRKHVLFNDKTARLNGTRLYSNGVLNGAVVFKQVTSLHQNDRDKLEKNSHK